MNLSQLGPLARLARAMPGHLSRPITPEAAHERLRDQLARRQEYFLVAARRLIYAHEGSPFRRLLLRAGCEHADLARELAAHGLEATLERLRDAGVYLTLAEFKGQAPIVRAGLTLEARESDFDRPTLTGDGIAGTTSGTRSAATKVLYEWPFLLEEAAHELVLYQHHGVLDAPLALWYPVLPGVAGVHNLLLNLLIGRPPERWFSQVDPAAAGRLSMPRLALAGIRLGGRLAGHRVPAPEFADLTQADRVLDWMDGLHRSGRRCAVRTFVSSAMRLVQRAQERGVDIRGATFFAGGEPMTDARRRFMEAAGVTVVSRYIATEPGLIAAACRERGGTDDMHLYADRLAVIPRQGAADAMAGRRDDLLYTTLTLHTGKVLLNTALGDAGTLARRSCACPFGRMGFDRHVSQVGSPERLTLEGMTVSATELETAFNQVLEEAGHGPDIYQFWPEQDERGSGRLVVAISPQAGPLDAEGFVAAVYARLARGGPGAALAAELWKQAGVLRVVRREPRLSGGQKLTKLVQAAADAGAPQG